MASESAAKPGTAEDEGRVAGLGELVTVAGNDREKVHVEAPFTGERIGTVPQCEPVDVETAAKRARTAQKRWARRPVDERSDVILRLHDVVLDRRDELLDVVQLEGGKARRDALEEIQDLAVTARYYANRASGFLRSERRRGAIPLLTRTEVNHHPVGVVGYIAPWNYPLVLTLCEAVPALLAGNAVVVKPAEQTPYTALKAKSLLVEAGLPPDCFQVVTGHGEPIGEPLVESVGYVSFTGSTDVGRAIGAAAAEHLTDFSLELGGKNPAIVREDADLDRTVNGLLRGCYASAGQLCISFERIYVHESVYAEFLDRFVAATDELTLGAGFDYDVEVGSLISAEQLERVEHHVQDARQKGATVEVGGTPRPDVGPYFFEPTVLTGVNDEMVAGERETFGPVVRIEPYWDDVAAVDRANDTDYGLNASVWTDDANRGRQIATEIEAGTVGVNDAYVATWGSVDAPMGGTKNSGTARRHGEEGFYRYVEHQTVATQRILPMVPPDGVDFERYAGALMWMLRLIKNVPGLR